MAGLEIRVEERDGAVIAKLIGEASLATSGDLERGLMGVHARRPSRLVLDLSELTFIASLALGNLVELQQRVVGRNGGAVRAAGLRPEVRKAFEHARLDQLFPFSETVDQALSD